LGGVQRGAVIADHRAGLVFVPHKFASESRDQTPTHSFLLRSCMEIIFGIVAVVVLLFVIGKMKGPPDPAAMSDGAILLRLGTEGAWVSNYLKQPLSSQQSDSLKRMYEEKTTYIQSLKAELMKRQMAQGVEAVKQEITPILQRTAELMEQGQTEEEARVTAVREWGEKNK
jgi:hypothetical protein